MSLMIFFYFVPVTLWITALASGVHIALIQLVSIHIHKISPSVIVNTMITAVNAGLKFGQNELSKDALESCSLRMPV